MVQIKGAVLLLVPMDNLLLFVLLAVSWLQMILMDLWMFLFTQKQQVQLNESA